MKIVINLELHQIKNAAMVKAGLNPQAMALKPGNRVHRNVKKAANRGQFKHKSRQFD